MRKPLFIAAFAACALASAFLVGRVSADPAPVPSPLVFYGVLEDNGVPSTAANAVIALSLWKDATSTDAAARLCDVRPSSPTPLDHGRFELQLGSECVSAVRAAPGAVFAQVDVAGLPLGRAVLGSVPNAERAAFAQNVDWSGVQNPPDVAALEERISALEGRVSASGSYTTAGRWCATTSASSGNRGGYALAKDSCETACGSPTAHVCTAEEMVRTFTVDGVQRSGWIATGNAAEDQNDCEGFRDGSETRDGTTWLDYRPARRHCNQPIGFLCCD